MQYTDTQRSSEGVQQLTFGNWVQGDHQEQISTYLHLWGCLQQVLTLYAATPTHHAICWVKDCEPFQQAIQKAQDQFPQLPTQIDDRDDPGAATDCTLKLLSAITTSFEQRNLATFLAWIEGTEVFLEAIRCAQHLCIAHSAFRCTILLIEEAQRGPMESTRMPGMQTEKELLPQALSWYQYAALFLLNGALVVLALDQSWMRLVAGALILASSFLLFEHPWACTKAPRVPPLVSRLLSFFLVVICPLALGLLLHTFLPLIGLAAVGWFVWRESKKKRFNG